MKHDREVKDQGEKDSKSEKRIAGLADGFSKFPCGCDHTLQDVAYPVLPVCGPQEGGNLPSQTMVEEVGI